MRIGEVAQEELCSVPFHQLENSSPVGIALKTAHIGREHGRDEVTNENEGAK
jgi:hypothetical protein